MQLRLGFSSQIGNLKRINLFTRERVESQTKFMEIIKFPRFVVKSINEKL